MFGHSDRRARERLAERGQRAWASVLEIAPEGKEITDEDGQPAALLKCRLRVEAADGFPFFFEDKLAFPQLGVPSVGSRIAVVYDPKDHDTLLLDRAGVAPAAAPAPAPAASAPAATGAPASVAAFEFTQMQPGGVFNLDLGAILEQVQAARAVMGDDPVKMAQELQRQFMAGMPTTGVAPAAAEDPLDRLEKLGELKAKGILTDAEFAAAKAKILGEP
jgi:hypothetical protein